ncbi:MAG: transposase, partial [bacterium]|nr:transposase [bacterium]
MNKYNPNIHHRQSIRLKGYDYSQAGLYFITICCQNRARLFGKIDVGAKIFSPQMILNDAGKIATECWLNIPNHFPNVVLHEFIIMPNHIHGIVELTGAKIFMPEIAPDSNGLHEIMPDSNGLFGNAPNSNGLNEIMPDSNGL